MTKVENKKITRQEVTDWNLEVLEDGSVKVMQKIETEYVQPYREFLSDFRGMQNNLEKAKEILTDKYQNKVQEDIKQMQKEIADLKEPIEKAEKAFIKHNEDLKIQGMVGKVKEELSKPFKDINLNYMAAVWDNIMKNEKRVWDELDNSSREKLQKIKIQKNRQDHINRRKGKKK